MYLPSFGILIKFNVVPVRSRSAYRPKKANESQDLFILRSKIIVYMNVALSMNLIV